jgi:hypothetical protein
MPLHRRLPNRREGRASGRCPVIGYANKPAKVEALARVQAAAMTTSLAEITTALRATPIAHTERCVPN